MDPSSKNLKNRKTMLSINKLLPEGWDEAQHNPSKSATNAGVPRIRSTLAIALDKTKNSTC
jgi:hypothetical protein